MKDFINNYINNSKSILDQLDVNQISKMVSILNKTRKNEGRLFILGVGGGAGCCGGGFCVVVQIAPPDAPRWIVRPPIFPRRCIT